MSPAPSESPQKNAHAPSAEPHAGMARSRSRWEVGLAIAFCVALFAFVARDFFREGTLAAQGDGRTFFLPYYSLVSDFARAGHLLIWNPWSAGGLPDFADPQIGALSPLTLLFALITGPGPGGWTIYVWSMWLLGGVGIFGLGRHLRSPAWGCLVVAMAWLGCGFYAGQLMHTAHVVSFSFLPWILWRLDAGITRQSWLAMLQVALLIGLSGLGGYPGLTVMTVGFCVVWALARYWMHDETYPAGSQGSLGMHLVRVAVMLGVSAVILLPSYAGFLYETRGINERATRVTWDAIERAHSVEPMALLAVGDPAFSRMMLAHAPGEAKGGWAMRWNLYCGIAAILLACVAIAARPNSSFTWFLVLVALAAIATAMGPALPVRRFLYDHVPLMGLFRQSAFFRIYFHLAVAVLALIGARELSLLIQRRRLVTAAAVVLACISVGSYLAVATNYHAAISWWHPALWALMTSALVAMLYAPTGARSALVVLLCLGAVTDFVVSYNLGRSVNYAFRDPSAMLDVQRMNAEHVSSVELAPHDVAREAVYSSDNRHLMQKKPVLAAYTAFRSPFLPFTADSAEQKQRALATFAFASGPDPFWFSPTVFHCAADSASLDSLAQRAADPPLLVHSRDSMLSIGKSSSNTTDTSSIVAAPPMQRINCELQRYEPTSLQIKVDAPTAGWLLITDRWAPSWRASVDGIDTEVLGGNLLYRAIRVDAGTHIVTMWYDVRWLYWLIGCSWGMMLLIVVASIYRWARCGMERPKAE